MTSFRYLLPGVVGVWMGTERPPSAYRGKAFSGSVGFSSNALLPTDPAGTTTVTFTGVVAGSEIRVFTGSTEVAGVESCGANHQLTWDFYASGNSNNDVTIRIIHPDYRIKEFVYTTLPTSTQSIPIQPERDRWYSNPA